MTTQEIRVLEWVRFGRVHVTHFRRVTSYLADNGYIVLVNDYYKITSKGIAACENPQRTSSILH